MSKPDQLHPLSGFVGSWKTSGTIPGAKESAAIKVEGTDTYEWLPGGFFLLHQADVMIGNNRSQTFEVIGTDKNTGKFTMQYYNNKGESGSMTATEQDGTWRFQGDALRFTGSFKNSGHEFSGQWEQLNETKQWVHLMDIKLTKQ